MLGRVKGKGLRTPISSNDGYVGAYNDRYFIGGFRVVENIEERDSIECCYRKLGMEVVVEAENFTKYVLERDICSNSGWEKSSSNIGSSTDSEVEITQNSQFSNVGQSQKTFNKNISDYLKGLKIPTKTSDLQNDGEGGDPFGSLEGVYDNTVRKDGSNLEETISWRNALQVYSKGEVSSKFYNGLNETNTSIDSLSLSGNTLTIKYKNERGVTETTSVDLSGLSVEEPVTSEFTVTAPAGSFKAGETFPGGLTLSQALIALLTDVFEPTFVAPSYSLSNNAGSREVGEVITLVLTSTFNRGIIKGAMVDGTWNADAFQNPRAGLPNKHTFDDIAVYITTSLTQSKTISNYTVAASNTFSSSVDYTQGVHPKNSENEDYGTPLAAGSLADTTSFNGGLRRFAGGVTKVPTTGTEVRIALLNTSVINTSNSFSFTTGTTNKTFVIAIPSSKTLTGVKNEGTNENLLSSFVLSEITVVPDAGNTDRPYKVYIMDNAVAFSSNYTISVTLA